MSEVLVHPDLTPLFWPFRAAPTATGIDQEGGAATQKGRQTSALPRQGL